MTQQEHLRYTNNIADYVLGLLSELEQHAIEQHAAICTDCRAAISAERQLAHTIHSTLAATRLPSAGRMADLMPEPPVRKRRKQIVGTWQRGFAIAALVLFLWMGNFGWQQLNGFTIEASPAPTEVAATATTLPTATVVQIAQATALPPSRQPTVPIIKLTPVVTRIADR